MDAKKTALKLSFWQRRVSPRITWVSHHWLSQPSRNAFAGSLREQSKFLSMERKKLLTKLLADHKLIHAKFKNLDPQNLKHYHFCAILSEENIEAFRKAFNEAFEGLHISLVAGQFSILKREEAISIPPPLPDEGFDTDAAASALLLKVLVNTNRPLKFKSIKEACMKINPDISSEDLAFQLGIHVERRSILKTSADADKLRYFPLHREPDFLENNVIFQYVNKEGNLEYLHHVEAKEMAAQGKICQTLRADGSSAFYSVKHLNSENLEIIKIKRSGDTLFVFNEELDIFIEKGKLVRGLEGGSLDPIYIDARNERNYRFEIFNSFVCDNFEKVEENDNLKLRAAFKAGSDSKEIKSITEFLYEARIVAGLSGDIDAVVLALLKKASNLKHLKNSPDCEKNKMAMLEEQLNRLNYLSHFPFFFKPDWPYSLQNYINHIYDECDSYEVFVCLLVNKLNALRQYQDDQSPLPPSLIREIELVYAPLAESKGFIDLSNDMRDLVCRLVDAQRYQTACANIRKFIGMDLTQGRRHLARIKRELKEELLTAPDLALGRFKIKDRLKEPYAFVRKMQNLNPKDSGFNIPTEDSLDILGVRIVCASLEEAEQIANYMVKNPRYRLSHKIGQKEAISYHLREPNENGWFGWRGYFLDPTIEDAEQANTVAIQILTREMEIADKVGKVGHWIYKAERAAQIASREMGEKYHEQNFDPPPVTEYKNDARHDFYVDRDHARGHKRIFVLPEDFSPNSFQFPEDGIIPILRLNPYDTVADAVAFRAFGDSFIEDLSFASLYLFQCDASGKYSFIPYKRGSARASFEEVPPNACFLVPKSGNPPDAGKLAELNLKAKKIRTRLLIGLALNEKRNTDKDQLVNQGKRGPLSLLVDTPEKQDEVIRRAELRHHGDRDELWLAIALGLIDEDMVRNWLGIFEPSISLEALGRDCLDLNIKAADRPGLMLEVLSSIQNKFSILEARAAVNKRFFGYSPANISLSLKETEGGDSSISISSLQARLTNLEYLHPQVPQQYSRIKVFLPNTRKVENWDILHPLLRKICERGSNIVEINLPHSNGSHPGEIIIETCDAAEKFLLYLEAVLDQLQSDVPNIRAFIL